MDPFAERQVIVGTAPDIELVRVLELGRVAVGGGEDDEDNCAGGDLRSTIRSVRASRWWRMFRRKRRS